MDTNGEQRHGCKEHAANNELVDGNRGKWSSPWSLALMKAKISKIKYQIENNTRIDQDILPMNAFRRSPQKKRLEVLEEC
jgi:hypothetical protein